MFASPSVQIPNRSNGASTCLPRPRRTARPADLGARRRRLEHHRRVARHVARRRSARLVRRLAAPRPDPRDSDRTHGAAVRGKIGDSPRSTSRSRSTTTCARGTRCARLSGAGPSRAAGRRSPPRSTPPRSTCTPPASTPRSPTASSTDRFQLTDRTAASSTRPQGGGPCRALGSPTDATPRVNSYLDDAKHSGDIKRKQCRDLSRNYHLA